MPRRSILDRSVCELSHISAIPQCIKIWEVYKIFLLAVSDQIIHILQLDTTQNTRTIDENDDNYLIRKSFDDADIFRLGLVRFCSALKPHVVGMFVRRPQKVPLFNRVENIR